MTLAARARAWRAQRRRAILLETAATAAAGSAAILGLAALADRALVLPQGLRAAVLAAWGAWLARAVWTRGVRPWRAADWDAVFAAASQAWPATRAMLASAWALRAGAPSPGTSAELREEHLARADRLAAELPDAPLFVWSPSRRARALAAAAAGVLAANAAWGDRASWQRALAPWRDPSLERWVEVVPGDARVDWGGPAEVRARPNAEGAARGVRAADLELESRGADGAWHGLPWTRAGGGEAVWSARELAEALDYRVRWRGLAGRAWRLEPVPPPRWSSAVAIVRGARGEKRYTLGLDPAIVARRGDWVQIEAVPEGPLASAELRLSDEPSGSAMRVEKGSWRGGFLARRDAALSFALVSADGRRDPSPPVYAVRAAPVAPPTAELLSPQAPLVAAPRDSVPIAYAARDDGAITSAALVVRVAGQADRRLSLPVPSPPQAEVLGDYAWALSGLKPGDKAEFWIEAEDDASPRQTGRSEKGTVDVVDADAEHRDAVDARGKADAALEAAAALAERARDASRAQRLDDSRADTAQLRAAWEQARAATAEWARRSASDPRADPGLADEAARAAEELASAGREGLPAAERALAQGDAKAAEREQSALAEEARGVQRALRSGADSQSVQDLADRSADADAGASALAREAEKLTARGKNGTVSAAELERLQESLKEVEKALEDLQKTARELAARSPRSLPPSAAPSELSQARAEAAELSRALSSGDVAGAAAAARRLAERLRRMSEALQQAGRTAADSRGAQSEQGSSRVKQAWAEAAQAQEAAVEAERSVDGARRGAVLAAQKDLLARLDAELGRRRDELAGALPAASWPRGVAADVDEARRRMASGSAELASLALEDAAVRLRAAASAPGAAAAAASAETSAADAFKAAAGSLERGAAGPAPDAEKARPAAEAQARARASASRLRAEISEAAGSFGFLSGRIARRVDAALDAEAAGETALRAGDSAEGLSRGEAALAQLEEGGSDADSAAAASSASAAASARPASGGRALRAATGVRFEHVRLPSAADYQPPRELRDELRRSLGEGRPAAADSDVKTYLERLAR